MQPERAVMWGDVIGRGGIQPGGDDGAAQIPAAAGQRDLFGRVPLLRLVELFLAHHVEREDEVRLRLMLPRRMLAPSSNEMPVRSRSAFSTASRGSVSWWANCPSSMSSCRIAFALYPLTSPPTPSPCRGGAVRQRCYSPMKRTSDQRKPDTAISRKRRNPSRSPGPRS